MENQHEVNRGKRRPANCERRGSFLGTVLIILGIIWIIKEMGWSLGIPGWHEVQHSFHNFFNIFHVDAFSFFLACNPLDCRNCLTDRKACSWRDSDCIGYTFFPSGIFL